MRGHDQVAALATRNAILAATLVAQLAAVDRTRRHRDRNGLLLTCRGNAIGDLVRHTAKRVLGRHIDGQRQVAALASTAAARAGTGSARSPGKARAPIAAPGAVAAKDAVEDIAPAAGARAGTVAAAIRAARARHAAKHEHLVVLFALLLVRKRLVGLADLLKLGLVAAGIGVIFLRELAKRALDLFVGGALGYAQDVIEGFACSHRSSSPVSSAAQRAAAHAFIWH